MARGCRCPASPKAAASGASPTPSPSHTITMARRNGPRHQPGPRTRQRSTRASRRSASANQRTSGLVAEPGHLPLRVPHRLRDDITPGLGDRHASPRTTASGLPVADGRSGRRLGARSRARAAPAPRRRRPALEHRAASAPPRRRSSARAGGSRPTRASVEAVQRPARRSRWCSEIGRPRRPIHLEGAHDAHAVAGRRCAPPPPGPRGRAAGAAARRRSRSAIASSRRRSAVVARRALEEPAQQRAQVEPGAADHDGQAARAPRSSAERPRAPGARSRRRRSPRPGPRRRAGGAGTCAPLLRAWAWRCRCRARGTPAGCRRRRSRRRRSRARRRASALLPDAVGPTMAISGRSATAARPSRGGAQAEQDHRAADLLARRTASRRRSPVAERLDDAGFVLGAQRALDGEELGVEQLVEAVHQEAAPLRPRGTC